MTNEVGARRSGGTADTLRSGRSGHYARVGSNPTFGTGDPYRIGTGFSYFTDRQIAACRAGVLSLPTVGEFDT